MFHDQIQNYLRNIPAPGSSPRPSSSAIDVAGLRTHLLSRLKQLPESRDVRELHESWSERLPGLADFLRRELPSTTTSRAALATGKRVLEAAIPIPGVDRKASIDELEARRLLSTFDWEGFDIARYAVENRLTRLTDDLKLERTVLATTLLRLSGRDAVRWLLTVETERSTGEWDQWSVSRGILRDLLDGIQAYFDPDSDDLLFPCSERTLKRLVRLGVAVRSGHTSEDGPSYNVAPLMNDLVHETVADDPWRAVVRAALSDETQRIVSIGGSSLKATSELSRIVTHEIRNALVPVRHHATALLDEAVVLAQLERAQKILRGVSRVLRFVDELVTISETVTTERLRTPLEDFISEVVQPLEGVERIVLTFDRQDLELPREPLARALRNVVQNALQLTAPPTAVDLEVFSRDGYLLFHVDDGGVGVPVHLRERVFEDGFTTRDGGSGYGLTMTRRILTELGGWVRCEASPLGGARFVLALPLSEPTS